MKTPLTKMFAAIFCALIATSAFAVRPLEPINIAEIESLTGLKGTMNIEAQNRIDSETKTETKAK